MLPRRSCLALFASLALGATALPALADPPQKLFFIQRSKNADEVHYDARVGADGNLDPKNPVDGYWMNKNASGGFTRDELTTFQKMAYGWDTEPGPNGTVVLKLKAFKDRPMSIVKAGGRWRVQTTIAGKQAYLTRLYVATKEGGIMPTVLYVDVFGEDAGTGGALTEHIVKN
jgi:hypothetical protein